MLLSQKWLEQYLPKGISVSHEELREKLTNSLAEVEDIFYQGMGLEKIVVGEIKDMKVHPRTDKLTIVSLDVGLKNNRSIVCAATNLFKGAKVPVALPGGKVYNPGQELGKQELLTIKVTTIREEKSYGMLCSQKELALSDEHEGIWILPSESEVGLDLTDEMSDTIYEIENKSLTNRPDCFSHVGIARELGAILKTPFSYPEETKPIIATETLPLVVKVEDEKLCKRYTAVAIQDVKVKQSPLWLQLRLFAIGIRPINNIVDATNYVMFELGQPIHAFDYNKLCTPRIIVRTAKEGENIRTLDEVNRKLEKTHLLIADPEEPIAIGGIMGGKNTEVDKDTQDIIIECANFEMYNIRKSTRELGLRTDASTRFEKGLDPNLTIEALQRVTNLIVEVAGGEIASDVIDVYPEKEQESEIEFEIMDVARLLGIDIKKDEILSIVKALHLEVLSPESSATKIRLKIPTFRQDLHIKEDILEEIARIYGYDKFIPTVPNKSLHAAKSNPVFKFEKRIKLLMSSIGFDELYTYSFIGEDHYKRTLLDIKQCIKLKNPLSPELEYMRTSLIPGILEKVRLNLSNFDQVASYILQRVYFRQKDNDGLPLQPKYLSAVITREASPKDLFVEIKGKLGVIFSSLHIENLKVEKTNHISFFHPNLQARIKSGKEHIGNIGLIHPVVRNNWKIKYDSCIFTLFIDPLHELSRQYGNYRKVPVYPSVRRDLSFWIDRNIEAQKVSAHLNAVKTNYVSEILIIDIFTNKKHKEKKSFTIQVTLQSSQKTLSEKQIKKDLEKLIHEIERIGGEIRGK